MKIKALSLFNYKNHEQFNYEFESGITCFIGDNGVGKTNILDAVYLLSNCKSYFNNIDYQLIRNGQQQCAVNGVFESDREYKLQMVIEPGKRKKLKKNVKLYVKLMDHIGLINVVFITP
ncbi:MAG: AAA family ATPase, partial [Bacteroidia bacterium]|nr:AAA family ATPase [Bacteroidia bacterium]